MDGSRSKGSSSSSSEIISDYRLGKVLGDGGFGIVKSAVHIPTGIEVAIKILNRPEISDPAADEQVKREINILRLFSHPHIVRFYEAIETRWNIYIVMEYMRSGDLHDYITEKGRIQEAEARHFFQQIISGVECCHLNKVSHRDLKLENVLLDNNRNIKIADFGLSNIMCDGHFLNKKCGSPDYAAPEVLRGTLYAGPEVDVWSCGVILYVLLCARLPFDTDALSVSFSKMKYGAYMFPSNISIGVRDLISRILVINPVNRLSMSEIRKHPWFSPQLPRYIAMPSIREAYNLEKINMDVIINMAKMGYDVNGVIQALKNGVRNKGTVIYFLLLDHRHGGLSIPLEIEHPELLLQDNMDRPEIYMRSTGHSPTKWATGIQFQGAPRKKMREVLKILQVLNARWKAIGHYNIKCLWVPLIPTCARKDIQNEGPNITSQSSYLGLSMMTSSRTSMRSENAIKFEIQIYKAGEELYLLDIQRINGPPLLFLELCAEFFTLAEMA